MTGQLACGVMSAKLISGNLDHHEQKRLSSTLEGNSGLHSVGPAIRTLSSQWSEGPRISVSTLDLVCDDFEKNACLFGLGRWLLIAAR